MKLNKKQKKLLEIYKQKMADCIRRDPEEGHELCDDVLCDLLIELGFDEIVEIYDKQDKWYA